MWGIQGQQSEIAETPGEDRPDHPGGDHAGLHNHCASDAPNWKPGALNGSVDNCSPAAVRFTGCRDSAVLLPEESGGLRGGHELYFRARRPTRQRSSMANGPLPASRRTQHKAEDVGRSRAHPSHGSKHGQYSQQAKAERAAYRNLLWLCRTLLAGL